MKALKIKYAISLMAMAFCISATQNLLASETNCNDAITTAEMHQCANEQYQAADAELNRVYRQLSAQLSPERLERLKATQRAWIAFRDKNAAFVASAFEGGTMYPLVELSELTTMTTQRTQQLKEQLK